LRREAVFSFNCWLRYYNRDKKKSIWRNSCRISLKKQQQKGVNMLTLVMISTTFESKEDAEKTARLLLNERLIACAQVSGPITSYYRWEGSIATSTEFTLTLKTTAELCEQVNTRLKETHPYQLPEIVAQTSTEGSVEYAEWVESEVG
jgi:periplasmic divalent cation tolerance protein